MSILSDISIARRCGVDLNGEMAKILEDDGRTVSLGSAKKEMDFYEDQKKRREFIDGAKEPMITPFVPKATRKVGNQKIVSYGLSAGGYDVRLANKYKIFTNTKNALIDPLNVSEDCYVDFEGDVCVIPPNSYVLGYTMETFKIPRDILAICVGKSTYARLAAAVNVTPIEPGFEGSVVIEIANCSTLPLKVYSWQGIAQFIFHTLDQECMISYADKGGKYMLQSGLQTALL